MCRRMLREPMPHRAGEGNVVVVRGLSHRIIGVVAGAVALAAGGITAAPAASATNLVDVLDNPSYWQPGNQADIIQFVNMSYGSSHPRYSTHRVDVLLDDGGKPLPGTTYLKLTTNFAALSGTTTQDEFVSAVALPAGVTVADSAATPIFCRIAPNALLSDTAVPFQPVTDGTCRQGVKALGNNSFAVNDKVLNRGDVWEIYVPVTSGRAMSASEGAPSALEFRVTNAHKDATEPAVAVATNNLTVGAPAAGSASASTSRAGARCAKAGLHSGAFKCAKVKGKLVWKRA